MLPLTLLPVLLSVLVVLIGIVVAIALWLVYLRNIQKEELLYSRDTDIPGHVIVFIEVDGTETFKVMSEDQALAQYPLSKYVWKVVEGTNDQIVHL